ncbi:MAG: hypothetical protein LBH25_15235 [Fibromonadaceae bacterium]|jgi:uncharacterized protein (TIGR02145 family)|nr:hypothetical protein [Fibromonadaceae bacterium]
MKQFCEFKKFWPILILTMAATAAFAQQKGTFKDARDGKTYKTTKIGTQTWMAENLNYNAKGSKCNGNKDANCAKYGRLYDWATTMDFAPACNSTPCISKVQTKHQGVCPAGWRIPSWYDWNTLMNYIQKDTLARKTQLSKMRISVMVNDNIDIDIVGHLMSESGWNTMTLGAQYDTYGFNALPGGYYGCDKFGCSFDEAGPRADGTWWLSNEDGKYEPEVLRARRWGISAPSSAATRLIMNAMEKTYMLSVRCLQGEPKEPQILKELKIVPASPLKDSRDGKTYKTVKIGNQTWMAENMNYEDKNSKCYDNKPENCKTYGRLYDWDEALTSCPKGWHLPTDNEWRDLFSAVDEGYLAGVQSAEILKAKSGWNNNNNGEDKVGFAALPGGEGRSNGFSYVGFEGYWWGRSDQYERGGCVKTSDKKMKVETSLCVNFYSVRCLQGETAEQAAKREFLLAEQAAKRELTLNPGSANNPTFTDPRDKKTYKKVVLRSKNWMAENLNYDAKGSKCYDNKPDNCKKYGRLYDMETAKTACPAGWRLPTGEEWSSVRGLGGKNGVDIKAGSGWDNDGSTPGSGTDKYGFGALPGGSYSPNYPFNKNASFHSLGKTGTFWHAIDKNSGCAYIVSYASSTVGLAGCTNDLLYSIRCVNDLPTTVEFTPVTPVVPQLSSQPAEQPKPASQQPQQTQQPASQPSQPQKPAEQPKQQAAKENCNITFPKKSCVSVPKGSCKMMGGKVVDKCK